MKIIFPLIFLLITFHNSLAQSLPNNGFESWESNAIPPYDDPEFWNTPNLYTSALGVTCVNKSEDAFSGFYAARLETVEILGGMFRVPGMVTYGDLAINILDTSYSFSGGIFLQEKVQSLSGQYQFQGAENDSAMVLIYCFRHLEDQDIDTIGIGYSFLHDAEEWTSFTVDMVYLNTHQPDTFNVLILSTGSLEIDKIKAGSVMLIDDIIIETGLGISDKYQVLDLTVYPNPVNDYISFRSTDTDKNRSIIFFDINGRKLKEVAFDEREVSIQISDLLPGTYFYRIVQNRSLQNSGTFIKR